ncbi:hypothetical protein [Sandaracinus amylolyticus]|uniref:hypothetical protein n=1 Tax=Sandaracinus amylolyticus TaxID=927083 RepID=UPI001F243F2E|nr:hypothetical protein [Sandaracinus amylolyticus]
MDTVETLEWPGVRAPNPSDDARALTPREVARCAHFYPYVETSDIGLDWRILGVAVVLEASSERTRR